MVSKKKKLKPRENQSSTGGDEFFVSSMTTPPAKPLNEGQQAYQLAIYNKQEIDKIREEILKPIWLKNFIISANSIIFFIKTIVAIFLLLLVAGLIVFVVFSYIQLNQLVLVLEFIKDNKSMEINQELLRTFEDFYYYAQKTVNINVSFLMGIGILALLANLVLALSKHLIKRK